MPKEPRHYSDTFVHAVVAVAFILVLVIVGLATTLIEALGHIP